MEITTGSRSVSLRWKLLILIPLAVAVVLAVISSRQTDLHAGNKLTIIANLFVPVSLVTQALYWTRVKKWTVGFLAGLGDTFNVLPPEVD